MGRRLPWEIRDARDVLASASRQQEDHQETIKEAVKAAARADQLYRVALAQEIARLREAGTAATLCEKLARGDERIANLAYDAAVAEGDREIAIQEGWRLHANRKDSQQLSEWSMRRDLAVDFEQAPKPEHFENVTPPRVE